MVGSTNIGLTYRPTDVAEDGTIVLRSCNIKNGKIDLTDLVRVTTAIRDNQYIENNDILICARNGSKALVGKCAIFTGNAERVSFGAFMAVYRSICFRYVYYYLNTALFRCAFDNDDSKQINQVTQAVLRDTMIPLPPFEEQMRIAMRLDELVELIDFVNDETDSIDSLVRSAKSKILDLAIRGQLVPQDPADEPASVLLECIQAENEELIKQGKIKRDKKESFIFKGEDNSYYEKIGDEVADITHEIPFAIPDTFAFARLKSLWGLISGRDLSPGEYNDNCVGIPYITGASNFKNGTIEISRWTTSPQVVTHTGDLLVTCKGTIGQVAINNLGKAHIARQVMAIRNTFNLNIDYLMICISAYMESIRASAKGLIPGISREDVLNLLIPLPSETYQRRVVRTVSMYFKLVDAIEKSLS